VSPIVSRSRAWRQALAWRLRRHHLVERAAPSELLRVVADICGLHAQLASSAELSLWARIDGLDRDAVSRALWEQRTLVKLWAMRGTLHLVPADELGLWVAGLDTYTNRGMTGHPEIDALGEDVARALKRRMLTREELAAAVAPEHAELVRSSWGSYLKPASFRGRLCFGPSDDGRVRFTSPESWLGRTLERPEREEALQEIARRFLAAYAPCTPADLGLWFGVGPSRARKMLQSLGDEAVETRLGWVLTRDADELERTELQDVARLLPAFDPWVAGASRTEAVFVPDLHRPRVYRPQGWFSPVLLVNGTMAGVWKHTRKGGRLLVELEPFGRLPAWARAQLESEAERLAEFLGGQLELTARTPGSAANSST
jgi:hypothetical protein